MKTKKFYESLVEKVNNNKGYSTLTEEELKAFLAKLKKGDTRMVGLRDIYGLPTKTESSNKKEEEEGKVELEKKDVSIIVRTITPENYKNIMLPGISPIHGKTRYSTLELSYLRALDAKEGITNTMIAELLGRSVSSVENQISKIHKSDRTFGTEKSNAKKYSENKKFFDSFNGTITRIGDLYCGTKMWWKNNCPGVNVISNDIDEEVKSDYNKPSVYLLSKLKKIGKTFDIIDLDTYTYVDMYEIEKALDLATMGLVVTFGDRRGLKNAETRVDGKTRQDTVEERYGIEKYDEDAIINEIKSRALELYSKRLTVFSRYSTGRIWRVYFKIEEPTKEELICLLQNKLAEAEKYRLRIIDKIEKEKEYWNRPVETFLK